MKKAKDGKYMSGGMTLLPTMKQGLASPTDIIDLSGLKNSGVTVSAKAVTVKAGTTHAEVAADKARQEGDPGARRPGLCDRRSACAQPRHHRRLDRQQRSGGGLSAGGRGPRRHGHTSERKIPADKFFTGMFADGPQGRRDHHRGRVSRFRQSAAYAKFPNPASRYAMVGVFVAKLKDGTVRVAVTGAGPKVFRVPEMEAALAKNFSAKALAGISVKAKGLNSDMHASAEYRAHLIGVLARRAVEAAK